MMIFKKGSAGNRKSKQRAWKVSSQYLTITKWSSRKAWLKITRWKKSRMNSKNRDFKSCLSARSLLFPYPFIMKEYNKKVCKQKLIKKILIFFDNFRKAGWLQLLFEIQKSSNWPRNRPVSLAYVILSANFIGGITNLGFV